MGFDFTGFGSVATAIKGVVDKFVPDADTKLKLEMGIGQILSQADSQQSEINKVEAASTNWFVAGWRPFIGWGCGFSLAYAWVIRDWLVWLVAAFHLNIPTPPLLMQEQALELVIAMLGMGGIRAFEKWKGVAR